MPAVSPLTIDQLETGLRLLGSSKIDQHAFWDENIAAFRETVLLAIRETSDALLSPGMTHRWNVEFQGQLQALVRYLELADGYIARRSGQMRLRRH
jgi:hypothetical protein